MDFRELCIKHRIRVVTVACEEISAFQVQRRWMGVWWACDTFGTEPNAREDAKGRAGALEHAGRVVWP